MSQDTTEGIYSLQKLQAAYSQGKTFNFVFFFNFNEEDKNLNPVKEGCFSLFFPSTFIDEYGYKFTHCIQFMTFQKALLFHDPNALGKIMNSHNPSDMKKFGRQIENFDQAKWDQLSSEIVYKGNLLKFSQNLKLFQYILSFPKNTIFVEANPNDSLWGIKLSANDQRARDPFQWGGENQLGFQITKVRDTFLKSTFNGQIISYAYDSYNNAVNGVNEHLCTSLDFISSHVSSVNLVDYSVLTQLRISKCYRLQTVTLSNIPNLQIVDLLDNRNLQTVTVKNCPKLVTLDVGFCPSLVNLTGANSVKYLSAPNCDSLKNLELNQGIVYLNVSGTPKVDPNHVINFCTSLEFFGYSGRSPLKLSEITSSKSLKVLHLKSSKIQCDSISKSSALKIIIFNCNGKISEFTEGDRSLLKNIYVTTYDETNQNLNNFVMFDNFVPEYQKYQRMLYGPWGTPFIDLLPPKFVLQPVVTPPSNINVEKAVDSILGSIFGSAVLDMLGVGVEFIPNGIATALLPGNPSIVWSHPLCNRHNERFVRGTPTDDTSQCILIMRSIVDLNCDVYNSPSLVTVDNVKIDPCDFGKKLVEWIKCGHKEHKHPGGLGVGSTTLNVVRNKNFATDPIRASEEAWIASGKKAAPNGSVMRIASSGCFAFWDEKIVVAISQIYAKVTHFDPRCVFSSIGAALLISRYIQWNCGLLKEEPNIEKTLEEAVKLSPGIDHYMDDVKFYTHSKTIEELNLSEDGKIGYCLKAFGSAIWALNHCGSFEEAITKVLREGGDTDTNGAVVGAIVGAKFGMHSIPKDMINLMFVKQWMFREIAPYMKLMGIGMPHFDFL